MIRALGQYEIQQEIGAGGMGVVYRGLDKRLGRPVAIKVLPESYARDPDRRARFEREARLLASLDHPNIGGIYGIEELEGNCYLILEFVPGQDLSQRIKTGPVPVDEALDIARQVAAALEGAHERSIVHRDIKPANIRITTEGKVKVLDFGLGKSSQTETAAATADASNSPTLTAVDSTATGVILGTAAYMSPEQARGKAVSNRTDIWSFGCVLYEMLAGQRPFRGETTSDFIATILTKEPEWEALPSATPSNVRILLQRCLQKDPQKRLRHIGDARLELEAPPTDSAGAAQPAAARQPLLFGAVWAACGVLVAGIVAWQLWHRAPVPAQVARFSISLPPGEVVTSNLNSVAISPDGTRIAFAAGKDGRTQVYIRELAGLETQPVPGTSGGVAPFFSPDGRWLAFRHNGSRTVKKVALSGGAPVLITPAEVFSGASWDADGTIVLPMQLPGAVQRLASSGGPATSLTQLDSRKEERLHYWPQLLPGGKAVLFSNLRGGMERYDESTIEVQSLATGERRVLVEGGMCARYSPTGHLIYARAGTLLAVPFDAAKLAITGSPVPVLEGVVMALSSPSTHYSLSDTGTLVYAPGTGIGGDRNVFWVDRQGKAERVPMPPRMYLHPRISPDGREIAIEIEGPVHDFYKYELHRGALSKMSLTGSSHWPLWTPDGKQITFRHWMPGGFTMWWMPADRSSPEERLTTIGAMQSPADWTPDGKTLAFTQVSAETGADVYMLPVDDPQRKPRPFAQTRYAEGSPRFSPDGHWVAYTSNESGRNEIYVQAYPGPGPKVQVSIEGGMDAVWKRNGEELFYRNGEKMMAVLVRTSSTFTASTPRVLWEGRYALGTSSACGPPGPSSSNYDVTADGQRFLMIKDSDTDVLPNRINVVLNWTEELARIMRERKN